MISIILVEPETPGNIGAVARVMANFGFENLLLVNPKCDHLSKEASDRAKHAKKILENSKLIKWKYIKNFDCIIATTSQLGTDFNVHRSPITPDKLIKTLNPKANIALVFGREGHGLSNKEILEMDFVVTIPTNKKYPAMNLSHSVSIILYELAKFNESIISHIRPMTKKDKEQILKMFDNLLNSLKFNTLEKKKTQQIVWKKIFTKTFLSKREAFAVMGLLRKLIQFKE